MSSRSAVIRGGGTQSGSIHWKGKGRLSRRCSRHQARKDIYLAYLHQRNRCKGRYARQTRGAVPAPLPAGGGRFNMPRRRGPWTNASFLIRGAAPEWHAGIPVLLKSLPAWRRSVRACPLTPSIPCPPVGAKACRLLGLIAVPMCTTSPPSFSTMLWG